MVIFALWVIFVWTCLPIATSGDYQNLPNYVNPALNPDYRPVNNNNDPTGYTGGSLFEQCWMESTIPMRVALGDLGLWPPMCSPTYFDLCETRLPVALLTYGLEPYQRDYVMSVFQAWVRGGGTYLCNVGFNSIQRIMDTGGRSCLSTTAFPRIDKCNRQLVALGIGKEYTQDYCYQWDNDLQCYIDAVNTCPDDELANFLWDFFKNIMYDSPCKDISKFTNAAQGLLINRYFVVASLLLPVLSAINRF